MNKQNSETLFRQQAISALSKRPFGRPIAITPKPWAWLTSLIMTISVVAAFFLSTVEYSRKEAVRGWIVAGDGVARITHNTAGVVESISATLGETVSAGEPLIYLSKNIYLEDGRNSGDESISELGRQVATIDRQVQLLREEANIEQISVTAQLRDLQAELNAVSNRRAKQGRRLDAASDQLSRLRSLATDGAVSEWELMRHEDEQAVLKQALDQMQQSEFALQRDRERLLARAKRLPIETEGSIVDLQAQQSRLRQEITSHKMQGRVVLKSPIAGKLASLEAHQGAAVMPNQLLATVVPESLGLFAEAYVPSSAIGFIRPGQRVRLVYDAFPQQKFGAFTGVVEQIAEFILLPSEVPQTFFVREATFKIRIAIEHDSVILEAGDAQLRPGMLLAAEIILESRSLLNWLLEPVRLRRKDAA